MAGNRDQCGRCRVRHGGNDHSCPVHGPVSRGCCVPGCDPDEWALLGEPVPGSLLHRWAHVKKADLPAEAARAIEHEFGRLSECYVLPSTVKRPNQIALTLPPQQQEPLDRISDATGRARSELIREAIAAYLKQQQTETKGTDR
jgi:hypothetical protein